MPLRQESYEGMLPWLDQTLEKFMICKVRSYLLRLSIHSIITSKRIVRKFKKKYSPALTREYRLSFIWFKLQININQQQKTNCNKVHWLLSSPNQFITHSYHSRCKDVFFDIPKDDETVSIKIQNERMNILRYSSSKDKQLSQSRQSGTLIDIITNLAMNPEKIKVILIIIALSFFIVGFVLNLTSDQSLYNEDLNIVPGWQNNPSIASSNFMTFMNIISILFDPPVCAGYLALFWLISSRRLQIMVFLIWFIFMSWLLTILKSAIQQPRPFWNAGSGIIMDSWTCYTQFGCPSGHSWMGLVLMEYVVRFYARWYPTIRKNVGWFYILVLVFQCLVMFSRVILGMHTFNEVLMGTMLGLFSICLYYIYAQRFIISMLQALLLTVEGSIYFRSNTRSQRKVIFSLLLLAFVVAILAVDLIVYLGINYQNQTYWKNIKLISGCENVQLVKSFQYRCLQDSAIIMAAVGIIFSLIFTKDPSIFVLPLGYSRLSLKFLARVIIFIVLAAIPLAAFLNPGWSQINVSVGSLAVILWVCQMLGFLLAMLMLLLVGPLVCKRCGLQQYGIDQYLAQQQERGTQKQLQMSVHGRQAQSQPSS